MSEETVKIEVEIPVGLHRFLKALSDFSDLRGQELNDYVVKCMTQGILDSLNPNCDSVKLFDLEAYERIKGLYQLGEVLDP